MTYAIIDNFPMPEKTGTRIREKGEFATAVASLEVGQGFQFTSMAALKNMYPRLSPKKFGGKTFQVAQVSAPVAAVAASEGVEAVAGVEGVYAVKRKS